MKAVVVLDVGKTLSKLTLWSFGGQLLARESRLNARLEGALDVEGIGEWVLATLERFGAATDIGAIIPVGHGAAAVLVRDGHVASPPMDYETPIAADERRKYDSERDPFAVTGSPALPDGLNLGAQLHHLETTNPVALQGTMILLWPQYWAWFLSGVAASEITSLGCHTDLWRPVERRPSELAKKRGWASMLPPLRSAGEALGPVRPEIARRSGLKDARVHCGLHDSNAALLAARAFPPIAGREATVLSTGTWFVAMRTPAEGTIIEIGALPESRDCLVNVDVFGAPVPSSRFMGGREIELLTAIGAQGIDTKADQGELVAAVPAALAAGALIVPTFAPGVGPYPYRHGRWIHMPQKEAERRAAVGLYTALVADASLDLIGSRNRILVEGRFAQAEVITRGIASLRPDSEVYVANAENDVSFGALRLLNPDLQPSSSLRLVEPLDADLTEYRSQWRKLADELLEGS